MNNDGKGSMFNVQARQMAISSNNDVTQKDSRPQGEGRDCSRLKPIISNNPALCRLNNLAYIPRTHYDNEKRASFYPL